jgi:hypothetical protein
VHALGLLSKLNPDGTAKHRILIDASRSSAPGGKDDSINAHQTKPASHYCNIEMAAAAICTRSSCWRADFEDSFMQIPFSFWSRRHTGIRWRGKLYAWRRGSYGYSSLPHARHWITIALIRAAVRSMEAAGLKCGTPPDFAEHFTYNRPATRGHEHTTMICLLDDTAGFGTSMKASTFGFLTYLWVCYSVGFRVSQKPGKIVGPSRRRWSSSATSSRSGPDHRLVAGADREADGRPRCRRRPRLADRPRVAQPHRRAGVLLRSSA